MPGVNSIPDPPYALPLTDTAVSPTPTPSPVVRRGDRRLELPDFALRFDPMAWLIEGQLDVELELELQTWLTLELIPSFVTARSQRVLGRELPLTREANFLGPVPGAAVNLGFWWGKQALHGSVIRAGVRIEGFTYRTFASANHSPSGTRKGDPIDKANYTRDLLTLEWGYHRSWGLFTVSGGVGLAYELSSPRRCLRTGGTTSSDCERTELILVSEPASAGLPPARHDLYSPTALPLHPFSLSARLSLGVLIE